MGEVVLVDTSYWIALFDQRDVAHNEAARQVDYIEMLTILVPWPILYETLRTRFVRSHPSWMARLDSRLKKPNTVLFDDSDHRDRAYDLAVAYSVSRKRPMSMVDVLCRLLIEDPQVRIDYVLSTNHRDFLDVCRKHRVELL